MRRFLSSPIVAAGLTIVAAALAVNYAFASQNADLMASWIAGRHLLAGLTDHVYPGYTEAFTLHPHPAWPGFLEDTGYRGTVFPFIYPPGWAWAMGHFATIESFWVFAFFVLLANTAMLGATIWLAMRVMGNGMPRVLYVGLAALLLGATHVGTVPLLQGQPQILVSFLLVLAIERSRSNNQVAAGAALAIAAALKLYPALFALIWLVTGERRALASFAIVGGGLAGLSVALTGWDLHMAFLRDLSVISDTVLVTGVSYNLPSSLAQLFFADDFTRVLPLEVNRVPRPDAAWYYLVTPPALAWISKGLLATVLAAILWLAAHAAPEARAALVWPLALTASALVLPLSWSYYFIPGFAFLPGIAWRLGRVWGTLAVLAVFVPVSAPVVPLWRAAEFVAHPLQLVATLSMCALVAAMIAAIPRSVWGLGSHRSRAYEDTPDGKTETHGRHRAFRVKLESWEFP